jgi:hypothetical protein
VAAQCMSHLLTELPRIRPKNHVDLNLQSGGQWIAGSRALTKSRTSRPPFRIRKAYKLAKDGAIIRISFKRP